MWSSDVQNTNAELIPVPCLLVILLLVLIRSIELVRVDSSLHYDTILQQFLHLYYIAGGALLLSPTGCFIRTNPN